MTNDWKNENTLEPIDLSQFQRITSNVNLNEEKNNSLLIIKIQDATYIIHKEEEK